MAPKTPSRQSEQSRQSGSAERLIALPEVVADGFGADPPELGGVAQLCKGQRGHAGAALRTQKDRGAEPLQVVDQARPKKGGRDLAAAFDQDGAEATAGQGGEHGLGRRAAVGADLFDLEGFVGSVVCSTLVDEVGAPYTR